MHRSAEQTILMVDSSKFGRRSLAQILPFSEIDVLVTDSGAPPDILDELRAMGIEVHIACAIETQP
jgi:DeoR/GlpR family transcriptional regulator of sugar metabolism